MNTHPCPSCGTPATASGCPACQLRMVLDFSTTRHLAPSLSETPAAIGRYTILETLGHGGMGIVYKAFDPDARHIVALKMLSPAIAGDPLFVERFQREAATLTRFQHPNIVSVFDISPAEAAKPFIVMEYIDGTDLSELLACRGLASDHVLPVLLQIVSAIEYAHAKGVVHRDLKPGNILIHRRDDGAIDARLADFGLAKLEVHDFTLTTTGVSMGTAVYMAPEQRQDTASVDHRADLYSFGVLAYQLLTGELPTLDYRRPSRHPGVDPRYDRIIARCLRQYPNDRYASAAALRSDLQRITRPNWGRRLRIAAAALLALAAVAALAYALRPVPPPVDPFAPEPGSPTDVLTSGDFEWTVPENLGPGVNTSAFESTPFVTDDGLSLLFRSNRPGGFGEMDLYEARRAELDKPFANPVNLGSNVNTNRGEDAPFLTPDELTLYFVAPQEGASTATDLWLCRRASKSSPWGPRENLGPAINSNAFEFRPWLSRDGLRLTFTSLRPPNEGVWYSTRASVNDPWTPAQPYSADFNRRQASGLSFSSDGGTLLCHRHNAFFSGDLLWLARIDELSDPFRNFTSFGPTVNSSDIDVAPVASFDGRIVYFASNRSDGAGNDDIWLTRRIRKAPANR